MENSASVLVIILVLYQPCCDTHNNLWLSQLIRMNLWQKILHLEGCLHSSAEAKHVAQVYLWTVFWGGLAPSASHALPQLLIHPTPAMGTKQGLWAGKFMDQNKDQEATYQVSLQAKQTWFGELNCVCCHEHKHLITDSGIGKWMNKEVEQLKHLSSLLLRFNLSSSISPPPLLLLQSTLSPFSQAWLGVWIWCLSALLPAHSCPVLQHKSYTHMHP